MGDHGRVAKKSSRSSRPDAARPNATSGRRTTPSGNRAPAPGTGTQSSSRRTLERVSAPWLLTLHRLPRWLVPIGLAVMLFLGLLLSGSWGWLGAILMVVVGLFVSWLTALSWPILTPGSRAIRVVVAAVLFGLAALKALGRW